MNEYPKDFSAFVDEWFPRTDNVFFSKHLILYRDTETHQDAHAMNIRRIDNISLCCGLYNN